jgi:hypothetical protein
MNGVVEPVAVELVSEERSALCDLDDKLNGSIEPR